MMIKKVLSKNKHMLVVLCDLFTLIILLFERSKSILMKVILLRLKCIF